MIQTKKVLAIIPARGGSKGVPRKNIRPLHGKPLIAWTIEQGLASRCIDRLIVSTDDEAIAAVARVHGADVPFMRPAELAADDTPGIAPVLHALDELPGYDVVVLLQPTSPLRTAADIDGCLEQLAVSGAPACVSVSEAEQSPYWMYTVEAGGRMEPLIAKGDLPVRRQDLPPVFALNGAVYAADANWLRSAKSFLTDETCAFEMPSERSVDIDEERDFRIAETILQYLST